MVKFLNFFTFLALAFIMSCSSTKVNSSSGTTELSSEIGAGNTEMKFENKEEYLLSLGDTFSVYLKSNPSTGYVWTLRDSSLVSVKDRRFVESNPGLIGGGGIEEIVFVANGIGTDTISLFKCRPWLRVETAIDTFQFRVSIVEK